MPDEYDEDAEVIERLILDLYRKDPGDDRFRIYDEIALQTESLFGPGLGSLLRSGKLSKSEKEELLSNPAAAILLAYFVDSLVTYNALNGAYGNAIGDLLPDPTSGCFTTPPVTPTREKHKALAQSLRLVGRPGETHVPIGARLREEAFFKRQLATLLATEMRKPGANLASAQIKAHRQALRSVFERAHGEPFDRDLETHKSRMKVLKERLKDVQRDYPSQGDL